VTGSEPADPAEPAGPPRLTHLDSSGAARMVDVVSEQVLALLRGAGMPKGDALAVARIAGIQGAKRTSELIPLCHPIGLSGVSVDLELGEAAVLIRAQVKTTDRTGVEMEALTAVAVAGLALIDMVKAVDPAAIITDVQVESKSGGMSGDWTR
jgi:cyclic pyranopterin phosphate synthase